MSTTAQQVQTQLNNDIHFYIPADIKKSLDEQGNEKMEVEGIGSGPNEDSQGEFLDPRGFDLTDFKWINWNHKGKDDPSTIIGEPTHASITENNELFIKGILYPEMPKARAVWSLMQALKNSPRGNRLGLSVEGKVIERNPANPRHVIKARITAIAICPIPIYGATWVDFLKKGETESDWEYDSVGRLFKSQLSMEEEFWDRFENDDRFKEYCVVNNKEDRDLGEIQDLSSEERDRLLKTYTVEANQHVTKESVEGAVKRTEDSYTNNSDVRTLTKAGIYARIFDYLQDTDLQKAKAYYSFFTQLVDMEKAQYTLADLDKALNALSNYDLQKSESGAAAAEKPAKKEKEEPVEKSDDAQPVGILGENLAKALGGMKALIEGQNESYTTRFEAMADLFKSQFDILEEQTDLIKSQAETIGSLEKSLSEQSEFVQTMKEKLEAISGQPVRKSISTQQYRKADFEKSENGKGPQEEYHLKNPTSRKQLIGRLSAAADLEKGENGANMVLARAAQDLEIAHQFSNPAQVQPYLQKLGITVVD